MTLAELNIAHGNALSIVNDLYEMRLDHPELGNTIGWLKSYADAMDKLHEVEMAIIEHYQLENSIYKK